MQNVYCKALDDALKDGCFIRVFLCGQRYPVTRVEKLIPETGMNDLVSYYESVTVINGLFGAAKKFLTEFMTEDADISEFECLGIEREVGLRGYTLHLMGLPNGKVLAMICSDSHPNYIPVKSVIEDNVQNALELLNTVLLKFDFSTCDFIRFADDQSEPVYEYYKKKREEKK